MLGVNSTRSGDTVNGTVEWTQPVARANVIGFAIPLNSSTPRLTLLHTTHKSREMPIFAVMDSAAYYGCCPNVSGTPPSSPLDKGAFRLHADCRCAGTSHALTAARSVARLSGCVCRCQLAL